MTDDDSGKESKDKEQRANERATVADTPDSDPRVTPEATEGVVAATVGRIR